MEDDALVFTSTKGTPINTSRLRLAFKAFLVRAGLPDIRFHDLRHTCATLLFSKGVHPKVVQELLGHTTIKTTIQKHKTLQPSLPSLTSRWRRRAFNIIESLKEGDVARPFPVNR